MTAPKGKRRPPRHREMFALGLYSRGDAGQIQRNGHREKRRDQKDRVLAGKKEPKKKARIVWSPKLLTVDGTSKQGRGQSKRMVYRMIGS